VVVRGWICWACSGVTAAEGREGDAGAVAEQPALSFAGLLRQLLDEALLTAGGTGRGREPFRAVGQ
jgi:hypothetical protein